LQSKILLLAILFAFLYDHGKQINQIFESENGGRRSPQPGILIAV
jgi:hypothetical protein